MTSATNSQAEELFEKAGVPQGSQALTSLHWVVECAKLQFHELSLRPMTTVLQHLNECLVGRQSEGVLFILEVLINTRCLAFRNRPSFWRSRTQSAHARKNGVSSLSFRDLSYNGNVEEFFQKKI